MPDITMCFGTGCPLKTRCIRFLSEPDGEDQDYFLDVPFRDRKSRFFWQVREEETGT